MKRPDSERYWHSDTLHYVDYLESQYKKLLEEHNELLKDYEFIKQQNVDVHNEWKKMNEENLKLKDNLKFRKSILSDRAQDL